MTITMNASQMKTTTNRHIAHTAFLTTTLTSISRLTDRTAAMTGTQASTSTKALSARRPERSTTGLAAITEVYTDTEH